MRVRDYCTFQKYYFGFVKKGKKQVYIYIYYKLLRCVKIHSLLYISFLVFIFYFLNHPLFFVFFFNMFVTFHNSFFYDDDDDYCDDFFCLLGRYSLMTTP